MSASVIPFPRVGGPSSALQDAADSLGRVAGELEHLSRQIQDLREAASLIATESRPLGT